MARRPTRRLKVDMGSLELAFENHSYDINYYLDLETGDIIFISSVMDNSEIDVEAIEADFENVRYIPIPIISSNEGYEDMEDFIDGVEDQTLAKLLAAAIQGPGAFRRFKDVLLDYPDECVRWFTLKNARLQRRITDWLKSENIELDIDSSSAKTV
jgi:hypothetical protein